MLWRCGLLILTGSTRGWGWAITVNDALGLGGDHLHLTFGLSRGSPAIRYGLLIIDYGVQPQGPNIQVIIVVFAQGPTPSPETICNAGEINK